MKSADPERSFQMDPASVQFPVPSSCNLRRTSRSEDGTVYPIPGLPADILHMRVKEGSKIRNLLRFVTTRMLGEEEEEGRGGVGTLVRQVVFTGSGRGVTKTITCVEILKRTVEGLHQVSKLYYRTVTEVWEKTQQGVAGTSTQRTVPAICILLSKDPLDPQEPGYQPPLSLAAPTEDTERQWAVLRSAHGPSAAKRRAKRLSQDDVCEWSAKKKQAPLQTEDYQT